MPTRNTICLPFQKQHAMTHTHHKICNNTTPRHRSNSRAASGVHHLKNETVASTPSLLCADWFVVGCSSIDGDHTPRVACCGLPASAAACPAWFCMATCIRGDGSVPWRKFSLTFLTHSTTSLHMPDWPHMLELGKPGPAVSDEGSGTELGPGSLV